MSNQAIPQQQLPLCKICNLQPAPQSSQHYIFVILQLVFAFINIKFSVIALMFGYSFPKTIWKCPFCKRTISEVKNNPAIDQNVIIRLGNCMVLLSKTKIRIIAILVTGIMIYLYSKQPKHKANVPIDTTWQSLVKNCGYEQYIDNSFKSNFLYNIYTQSKSYWQIQGVFLKKNFTGITTYENIYLKMNPTQFQNPDFHDVTVFTKLANNMHFQKGDVVLLKGTWQGRSYHNFIFIPTQVINTGKKMKISDIKYFYKQNSMLRPHIQEIIKQEEQQMKQKLIEIEQNIAQKQKIVN